MSVIDAPSHPMHALKLRSYEEFCEWVRVEKLSRRSRVLICGSRRFPDADMVAGVVGELAAGRATPLILQGEEPTGADVQARNAALAAGLPVAGFPADWTQGRGAGYHRNERMLKCRPKRVIAFAKDITSSRGTRHTCEMAWRLGLPVTIYDLRSGAVLEHQREQAAITFDSLRG